jgi:hypothetical protein
MDALFCDHDKKDIERVIADKTSVTIGFRISLGTPSMEQRATSNAPHDADAKNSLAALQFPKAPCAFRARLY